MDKTSHDKKATVQSLEIGINLVDLLVRRGKSMRFNDIHQATDMSKGNLYKYLNTLTQLGLLYRDQESGQYRLGSRLIEYGMAAADREDLIDRITPILQEINQHCGETVLLSVWTEHGPMVVKLFNSHHDINIGARIGTYLPLYSAGGKIFDLYGEESLVSEWREKEWAKLSETEQKQFEADRSEIKQNMISFANEALVPQISSVGLPVFNYDNELVACFVVVGFTESMPTKVTDPLSQYLLTKSKECSYSCGWRA